MQITINDNTPHNSISKLLIPFLELNEKSDFDYFERDIVHIGHNWNSGRSYIYLESSPSLSLCYNMLTGSLSIIYSSNLDDIEFEWFDVPTDMGALEDLTSNAYNLEDAVRGDDYKNNELTEHFITAMESAGWEQL